MSAAAKSAHVRIVLADYVVGDPQGKMTLVGAGISIFGVNPESKTTAPFGVWANVTFAPDLVGASPKVEFSLETEHGDPVEVPIMEDGQPQQRPFRVGSSQTLGEAKVDRIAIPDHVVRPKVQFLLQFQAGLKLDEGRSYRWRVTVDGVTHDHWTETMYVLPLALG